MKKVIGFLKKLFGFGQVTPKGNDWAGVMQASEFHDNIRDWQKRFFVDYQITDVGREFLVQVGVFFNNVNKMALDSLGKLEHCHIFLAPRIVYMDDPMDCWQAPKECINNGLGDCEDWTGVLFWMATRLGFKDDIRMGLLRNKKGQWHTVLLYYPTSDTSKVPYVFDVIKTAAKRVCVLDTLTSWRLLVSFNLQSLTEWVHSN